MLMAVRSMGGGVKRQTELRGRRSGGEGGVVKKLRGKSI